MTFLDTNNDSEKLKKDRSTSAIGRGVRKNNKPKAMSAIGTNKYDQDTSQFQNDE